jgi:hypothetical protein
LCNDHFDWVRGGAEDGTDLRHVADCVQHIDRVRVLKEQDERMAAG